VVKLRFFAGLTNIEAAQALGISPSTADNDWAYARSWLRLALEDASGQAAP
jgi:DNA-directed RNA polymerase specialized sigma24 family protein